MLLLELSEDLCGAAELAPALLEAGVLEMDVQLVGQVVRGGAPVHVADLDECKLNCGYFEYIAKFLHAESKMR